MSPSKWRFHSCPKCQGALYWDGEDWHCFSCGFHEAPPWQEELYPITVMPKEPHTAGGKSDSYKTGCSLLRRYLGDCSCDDCKKVFSDCLFGNARKAEKEARKKGLTWINKSSKVK